MRKWFIMSISVITILSGCHHKTTLSLPELSENKVLITHLKEPMLAVIDTSEDKLIHKESFDFDIHSLAKIDDHRLVFTGKLESEVLQLDLRNRQVRPLISNVFATTDLYYDEKYNTLFLTDAKHNDVVFYDLSEDDISARIKVGSYPNAIAVHNNILYVLNGENGSVSVIDLLTFKITDTFKVVDRPTDIVTIGDHLCVVGHGSYGNLNKHVHVYNSSTGELVKKIKVGSMPIALYKDDHSEDMFVLSHGSNTMHVIDVQTFHVKKEIVTGENPYYVTGDNQYIYVTGLDGDNLILVDRNDYVIRKEYSLYAGPYGIVVGGSWNE